MKFPQKRLDMMNSMGNRMSLKRDEFPLVIQSDMTLFPERAGCPVIDVNGKFVGLALSRAGRTETYILPSWICRELVEGVLPQVQQYRAGRGEKHSGRPSLWMIPMTPGVWRKTGERWRIR